MDSNTKGSEGHRTAEEVFSNLLRGFQQSGIYWEVDTTETLVDNLYEVMEEQGVTKAAMARSMGFSRAYMSKLFKFPERLKLNTICKIAFLLGYRVRIVLEPIDNRENNDLK